MDFATIRSRYYKYMQVTMAQAAEYPSKENSEIAESASRRYNACLNSDFRTLWIENERILTKLSKENIKADEELRATERLLEGERVRSRNLEREIARIKRFHAMN
jgi:hypothetical protein